MPCTELQAHALQAAPETGAARATGAEEHARMMMSVPVGSAGILHAARQIVLERTAAITDAEAVAGHALQDRPAQAGHAKRMMAKAAAQTVIAWGGSALAIYAGHALHCWEAVDAVIMIPQNAQGGFVN